MSNYDPIAQLVKFGYTPRQADFLQFVGVHSGYFLRRQFNQYVQREDGALTQEFLSKALKRGHVRTLEYGQKRYLFHLHAKFIYRMLGIENSQNRRVKNDREIKARLMNLDYMLDHQDSSFLGTVEQRVTYFHIKLRIALEKLPQISFRSTDGSAGSVRYFADHVAIAITPRLSFAFIDDGMRTISAFERFLGQYEALLHSLDECEVVYAADSEQNFRDAERLFRRLFPRVSQDGLFAPATTAKVMPRISLRGHVLLYSYPLWSARYKGKVI